MNIEKRKVTEAKPLPVAAKSALAATLGLTVASTFIACMGGCIDDTPTSIPDDPQPAPSSTTPNDEATPESSSATETLQSSSEQTPAQQNSAEQTDAQQSGQEQTETKQSSSSQVVVDIPLSHEPISSSRSSCTHHHHRDGVPSSLRRHYHLYGKYRWLRPSKHKMPASNDPKTEQTASY